MHSKKYCNCMTLFFAVVFLTLPVGKPNARSATLLFSENFENGNLKAWNDCNPNNTITTEQVHSGTYALKYMPGQGCTRFLTAEGAGSPTIYLKMYWYFPSNFDATWQPGHHTFRISHRIGNQYIVDQFDTVLHTDMSFEVNTFWNAPNIVERDYRNTATFPKGSWFKFELLFRLGPVGQSNGEMYLWINGTQTYAVTGQNFRGGDASNIDTFLATTNFDSPNGNQPWYLDDIEVWNECPAEGASCSTGGTKTASPLPPDGLAVR